MRRRNLLNAISESSRWSTNVAIHRIITDATHNVFPAKRFKKNDATVLVIGYAGRELDGASTIVVLSFHQAIDRLLACFPGIVLDAATYFVRWKNVVLRLGGCMPDGDAVLVPISTDCCAGSWKVA